MHVNISCYTPNYMASLFATKRLCEKGEVFQTPTNKISSSPIESTCPFSEMPCVPRV